MQGPPQEIFSQADLLRSVDLRLPRITHLFEILNKEDRLRGDKQYPLTIGEARREILEMMENKKE
jgi:cobalt/nickel transport system ATP-binding protein